MFAALHGSGLVNVAEDDSAKDGAERIGIGRHHHDPDCGLVVVIHVVIMGFLVPVGEGVFVRILGSWFRLRSGIPSTKLGACRFTNFIVKNARRTARSWCARPNGRGPSVRTAVPRGSPRSFPCLPPPWQGRIKRVLLRAKVGADPVAVAAVAVHTGTDQVGRDCQMPCVV